MSIDVSVFEGKIMYEQNCVHVPSSLKTKINALTDEQRDAFYKRIGEEYRLGKEGKFKRLFEPH